MPPGKWDDASEKQMLLALIHLNPPTGANYAKVASMMDGDFSAEAVRQKLMKIKKTNAAQWGDVEVGEGVKKTPVKRGKKAEGEVTKSGGKRKSKKDEDEEDDGEEGGLEESPEKKVKVEQGGDEEDEV